MACTESHLLLLGDDRSHDSSDDTDDDSDNGDDTGTHQKQLKLVLRVKRSYDKAVVTNGFTLLICARGGTLDLFKVCHHLLITIEYTLRQCDCKF